MAAADALCRFRPPSKRIGLLNPKFAAYGSAMTIVPKQSLRPGYDISRIIKGGWQLAGDHGEIEPDQVVRDMLAFFDAGITAYDCADIYTGVEDLIGRFSALVHQSRGAQAAHSIRVHTKYVPDRDTLGQLRFSDVEAAIDRSLHRLRQEQLDLVQFHWWNYEIPGHAEAMQHLETLRQSGKIRCLGVTNFDAPHLEELCNICDVVSAQIQYSLLDSRPAGPFAELAKSRNVALLTYGVLAGGFLTDHWLGKPDPGFAFENRSLVKYRLVIEDFGGWDLFQTLLSTLRRIANRHGVEISTIATRAMLDNRDVAATIIGARYANRLPRTLKVFDIELTEADNTELEAVLKQRQGPTGPVFGLERDTTGRHGQIMKYNLNKGDNRLASEGTA